MKQHFTAGTALLDQERTAKEDAGKAPADQRDAAKAKVTDLSNQAAAEFTAAQKQLRKRIPISILSGPSWRKPTTSRAATTTPSTPINKRSPPSRTSRAITTIWETCKREVARLTTRALPIPRVRNSILPMRPLRGVTLVSACTTPGV